jgi:hypothetical protein
MGEKYPIDKSDMRPAPAPFPDEMLQDFDENGMRVKPPKGFNGHGRDWYRNMLIKMQFISILLAMSGVILAVNANLASNPLSGKIGFYLSILSVTASIGIMFEWRDTKKSKRWRKYYLVKRKYQHLTDLEVEMLDGDFDGPRPN